MNKVDYKVRFAGSPLSVERDKRQKAEAELEMMKGPHETIQLIIEERLRQISKYGYSKEHDDAHNQDELIFAAIAYLSYAKGDRGTFEWPWSETPFKPSTDQMGNLVKAAALIVAEIERIQRLTK